MIRPAGPADHIARHRYPGDADAGEGPAYAAWVADALTRLEWGPSRSDPQPWRARVVNVWTRPVGAASPASAPAWANWPAPCVPPASRPAARR